MHPEQNNPVIHDAPAAVVKRWVLQPPPESALVEHLQEVLNVDRLIATLLVQRGITSFEDAKAFFRPTLQMLHDPFLMRDMDRAVERLCNALETGEKILVYGDYDVDGTTSVALFYSFLKSLGAGTGYYIPDRYTEGYGISFAGIDYAEKAGYTLIVALDCGIKSVDKIAYAKAKGIDFIICDHHLPGEQIPDAVAVLDPRREDCPYPYKELSGCGIGFKLVQALYNTLPGITCNIYEYLDLVAVSIGADIVPLTGENRVLAWYGLERLNSAPRAGLQALISISGYKHALTISNVVFIIGPRINAAGRIDTGMDAVELLTCSDADEALKMAGVIDQHNQRRRDLDLSITSEALRLIEEQAIHSKHSTVLFKADWHKGVIGIVASRVIEKHYRPTILLTSSNGKVTGSARSVQGFDVYEAIEACSDLLEQFGGHKFAAGLTMPAEHVDAFRERFEKAVAERIQKDMLVPAVQVDLEIGLEDITAKFYRILKQFEPFGPGNMSPVFMSRGLKVHGTPRAVGKEKEHLSLHLAVADNSKIRFRAIAFGMGAWAGRLDDRMTLDIAYHLEENNFRGETTLQLRVLDIRLVN